MQRSPIKIQTPARYVRWLHTSNRIRYAASQDGIATAANELGRHKSYLPPVEKLVSPIDINEFRRRAFLPEMPILISADSKGGHNPNEKITYIPAAAKWFDTHERPAIGDPSKKQYSLVPSQEYLSPFAETLLPYETIIQSESSDIEAFKRTWPSAHRRFLDVFLHEAEITMRNQSLASHFCRFNAPLSLFLEAYKTCPAELPQIRQLYIAQAQISDLPKDLQDDLPTPALVKEAGKGDIYDTSIWMGLPPTYTPLHKDPNPNLFLQLAGQKVARLYKPVVGAAIFREVQQRIGANASASFRGQEMMEGAEATELERVIWGAAHSMNGVEAVVNPGDALFIPKGWWHSIRSLHTGAREVTASVNWWFR